MKYFINIKFNDLAIFQFYCPGCQHIHSINDTWNITWKDEKPTVSPSVLTKGGSKDSTCHLFIKNGMIEYLNDCGHKYAGKTIPMEFIDEVEND
jgi:hypothetical protein